MCMVTTYCVATLHTVTWPGNDGTSAKKLIFKGALEQNRRDMYVFDFFHIKGNCYEYMLTLLWASGVKWLEGFLLDFPYPQLYFGLIHTLAWNVHIVHCNCSRQPNQSQKQKWKGGKVIYSIYSSRFECIYSYRRYLNKNTGSVHNPNFNKG